MRPGHASPPTRGRARAARGLVASAVCLLLSFTGHVQAGGDCPDLGLLLVLGLLLTGLLVTLADRRRGPLAILGLVGGSQLALHALLQLLSPSHQAAPMHSPAGADVHSWLMAGAGMHPMLMFGTHALASVVTAAILAGAEAGVFAVAAALVRVLPRPPARLPATPSASAAQALRTPVDEPTDARPRRQLGRRLCRRRGPPGGLRPGWALA